MQPTTYIVQQPQQARSRETMVQILDAAAHILEGKTFEELTVAEVVQQAGTSVGAFYGRFKNKETLLQALDERWFADFEESLTALLNPENWDNLSLPDMIKAVTRFMVETYSKNQGVLRSLNLAARLSGDSRFKHREASAWNNFFTRFQNALLSHQDEFTHPKPVLATKLGFQQMFFSAREILLWESIREEIPYETEELIAELTRAYLMYLGVKEGNDDQ